MNNVITPTRLNQPRTALAANSGSLWRDAHFAHRTDVVRNSVTGEQLRRARQDVIGAKVARHDDRQALAAELVDQGQHAERPTVMGAVLNEIVRPNMVRPAWPQSNAGPVVNPQPAPLRPLHWNLDASRPLRAQPLAPPDPLDPLVVHAPTVGPQQGRDATIAIPAVALGQSNDIGR